MTEIGKSAFAYNVALVSLSFPPAMPKLVIDGGKIGPFDNCTALTEQAGSKDTDAVVSFLRSQACSFPFHFLARSPASAMDDLKLHPPTDPAPFSVTAFEDTPLHYACGNANLSTLASFVEHVLDLDKSAASTVNKRGDTPLHAAVRNSFIPPASLRVLSNAHPKQLKIKNNEEQQPLEITADNNLSIEHQVLLFSGHPVDQERFKPVAALYLSGLLNSAPSSLSAFPPFEQNGFVEFVSDSALLQDLSTDTCNLLQITVDFIDDAVECPEETARVLANAVDVGSLNTSDCQEGPC